MPGQHFETISFKFEALWNFQEFLENSTAQTFPARCPKVGWTDFFQYKAAEILAAARPAFGLAALERLRP